MTPAETAPAARRWPLVADAALALALGALQTLAFVHTAAWPLPLVALALLVARLDAAAPARAALLGGLFGAAWLAAGTWWLFVSMHRYGGLPAPLAVAAVAALSLALSTYLALACAAYARWRRGGASDVALFAGLWLLAELARGVLFTGFPWVALGYAQVDSPLAALAPWLGVYGMGALAAALAAALWRLLASRGRQWPALGLAMGVMVAPLGAPLLAPFVAPQLMTLPQHGQTGQVQDGVFTHSNGRVSVALLQTHVPQDQKFALEHLPATLAWVHAELLRAPAALVVAPETAVPLLPEQLRELAPGYWARLEAHFAQPGRAALIGVPLGDFERGYTNSVLGLSEHTQAQPYRYDKWHLVPFGEFIPTGFRWFTQLMNIPLGDFARGSTHPPPFEALGQRFGPNICYEDLFGEELARRFASPALAPTVWVNHSNIGWFGQTIAVDQHLHISRLRSLEFERPMLRATNTGATAVIDHRGVVTALLAPHTQGVLLAEVEGRVGVTPYAWWAARAGLWPLLALALLLCGAALARRPGTLLPR